MIHGLSPSGHDRVRTRHVLSASPTDEEAAYVHASLEAYNRQQTGGEIDRPGIEIGLVAKRPDGAIVGGIVASTVLRVMHLEALWVDAGYRDQGLGSQLV
ncbi:MAG: GNAT family N-acetyltransferase, partial [Anaerolineae bacterium]|nr:GNAT family N-acetyltransferase [Anaerolineae bacterium]